ncbi:MAG: DUF5050 domain-containing protein [Lachnospiraceae bacterium]|nr:DUF5050 domain-containing protein [Lachnospiraceae bacterium]
MRRKIIPILIVLIVIAIGVFKYLSDITIYNEGYVNGNLPGNLYNEGKFCEIDGVVYFSNPNDNGYLYSMNSDGTDMKLIYEDVPRYINADANYIYYVRNNSNQTSQFSFLHVNEYSLCRLTRTDKAKIKILDSASSIYLSLSGNYLYYLRYSRDSATNMYRIGIDGKDKEMIDSVPYYTCSANNEYLYFTGLEEDHNVYQYNTQTDERRTLLDGNYWMPEITDPAVYFLNCTDNYSLCKLDFTSGQITKLYDEPIESYVVYNTWIYFTISPMSSNGPALGRMSIDGSNPEILVEGNYKNLNVTTYYVYFSDYDDSTTYKIPTEGTASVSIF